ncbi:5-formyltetrahydrofolate cyclo-ligase [Achromobacter mucicolens]|uniref:5-formyltetrahydrofolate cyclo-ligase n=2 Tax=Achromobacter mucicolens TaxID=1389922 RepID=A0ABD4YRQ3_9BURK|nr:MULTISPECIES: 5-formyltetrahydrofolate cyclo-ligase [Achromobacter]MCP2514110.1 5-formyltetrahydrofolate cyclo-ligase [Achromobacter mucicolens]MCU6617763.1 5-formyltetrahydrofolate cyclo-ligase [Achromobacter mucicolens]MDH1177029.1 5-formyltetrahydrofolate cyclo-ligase [Achromobacter mucicolens]UDG75544.1 5-formyltetrahydrofolate cyclo-ligase [Achromobacter sp. 77]WBX88158.1 5-formyltetrahydrofolate cyclo-ligase [Achromobacter mucicolens]
MTTQNTPEDTAVHRTRLRKLRTEMPEDQRSRGALLMRARLFTWLNVARDQAVQAGHPAPTTVAAFWPMADEPDLRPLLTQWSEAGMTVALPVVRERNAPLAFLPWTPEAELRAGPYGIQEPVAGPELLPDVVLVPTLGYTELGDRLGYGGGYYDRTLAALRDRGHPFTAIGIAWSCGELDPGYVPAAHDVRLDAVLTQDGWVPHAPLEQGGKSGSVLHSYRMN